MLRMLLAITCAGLATAAAAAPLRFSIPEGLVLNEFFREGPVAAHLVLRPGPEPRIVVAFPAGNSGAALWLRAEPAFRWRIDGDLHAAQRRRPDGSVLRGVTAVIIGTGGPATVRQGLVGNVRSLRDYGYQGTVPEGIGTAPRQEDRALVWDRRRLDGGAGYYLSLELLDGKVAGDGSQPLALEPAPDGNLRLRLTALTGDDPLRPLDGDALLAVGAAADPQLRRVLEFLSYEDKLLAGSWRFNTYFGRDTLMSLCLLAPVLGPRVSEAGLESVLARLSPAGEVAHEEDIGEFAVLRRIESGRPPDATPIYDYKMIDDDFMLAIAAARYLLDDAGGRPRAAAFLQRLGAAGSSNGSALVRNFLHVIASAEPFADSPHWRSLIGLKPGQSVGNWRDSEAGLGGGRYPYDVNGVLVPAALAAIARIHASGVLDPYLEASAKTRLRLAADMAKTWSRAAPVHFDVRVAAADARAAVRSYSDFAGVDATQALREIGEEGVQFRAVALDDSGRPVPVVNSDEAFALLLLEPDPDEVGRIARTMGRPFPAGLQTGAGLVVANPAFAPAGRWAEFGRGRYHGSVVWSWHQALLRAGLDRQIARADLPVDVIAMLEATRARLLSAMAAARDLRGSELWSWAWDAGRYAAVPFGQAQGDETESNAAQLWSTVHLAWPAQ